VFVSNDVYVCLMVKIETSVLRAAFGTFTTGVTIVTCEVDGRIHGATVNSFTAVSLDPPLVLVSLAKTAKTAGYLRGRPFTVNVLSAGQHEHALHFSGRHQKSLVVAFEEGARISDCVAYIRCAPWEVYEAGDHYLFLGEVVGVDKASDIAQPLVFHRGRFRSLGPAADPAGSYLDFYNTLALSW
jgi:flavin reductase (DIM6/NTAB) family NADH-FMN oxidoreductase RutF